LEGVDDERTLRDKLSLIKPAQLSSFVNLYDFSGDPIYTELPLTAELQTLISENINDEPEADHHTYLFFNTNNTDYLLITESVKYNGLVEGLAAYIITLANSQLIDKLIADEQHWFGISQNKPEWRMSPPDGWVTQSKLVDKFNISLLYATSPAFLEKTENDFLTSLFTRMSFAVAITLLVLYVLGREILVSPFQALARSEKLLEQQADDLAIREAESTRLARVAKYMRDAVVFTDTNIKITWVNSAFEKITGYKQEEVIGLKPGTLLQGPETDLNTTKKIADLIRNRQFGTVEILNYTKSKTPYWLEIQIAPLFDELGELEGFMAVERDVTERIELQKNLEHSAKKAEMANVAKSQFLASMSHELRTPMNGVLGMTELIKDSALSLEQKEMVDTLLSSGRHMLSVLNDILDFSKIEAGKLNINKKSFLVSDVVSDVSKIYLALCDEKGLDFKVNTNFDEKFVCIADQTRVQQILQNLLNNAWKFTQKGSINVSIKVVKTSNEPYLELDVIDTGIGISKDKQEHVFEAFSQADNDTTRRFGGTGLGLAIISELVTAMKGSIKLESELGQGSRFTVIIPIELSEQEQQNSQKHGSQFSGAGLKVLIVEDNKINITVMTMFLKKRGFTSEVAVNGQIGVDKVQSGDFDIVIMDNHMPIMDGINATKAIKALNLPKEPLIIGCTADAFEQTRIDMINAGCCDVVTKPLHSSNLDEVLLTHVSSRQPLS
jgi:PAS domain S-box-containing protein